MADYQVAPGASFEYARQIGGVTGAAANLTIRIYDGPTDVTSYGPSGAGIVESVTNPGVYSAILTAPTVAGQYLISLKHATLGLISTAELIVSYTAATASVPGGTDLCTVADVKLAMESTSTAIDSLIQTLITAASSMIPNRYQRDFAPVTAATYTFKVIGWTVDLSPHDLRSATTVTLDPNGTPIVLATTQYRLAPSGAESNLGTYTAVNLSHVQNLWSTSVTNYGYAELQILGNWGPASVRPDVTRACALTVASWVSAKVSTGFQLDDLTSGDATLRPDRFGGFAIPLGAHMILDQYSRPAASFA